METEQTPNPVADVGDGKAAADLEAAPSAQQQQSREPLPFHGLLRGSLKLLGSGSKPLFYVWRVLIAVWLVADGYGAGWSFHAFADNSADPCVALPDRCFFSCRWPAAEDASLSHAGSSPISPPCAPGGRWSWLRRG